MQSILLLILIVFEKVKWKCNLIPGKPQEKTNKIKQDLLAGV